MLVLNIASEYGKQIPSIFHSIESDYGTSLFLSVKSLLTRLSAKPHAIKQCYRGGISKSQIRRPRTARRRLYLAAPRQTPSHTTAPLTHNRSDLNVTPRTIMCTSKSTNELPNPPVLNSFPMNLPPKLTCRKSIDATQSSGYRTRASAAKG